MSWFLHFLFFVGLGGTSFDIINDSTINMSDLLVDFFLQIFLLGSEYRIVI